VSTSDDGMLYVGRWASYEELRGRPKGCLSGVPPLLILMGKKSEKHFKENELFLFFGSEEALQCSALARGRLARGVNATAIF
jgi:hypothetical protein